MSLFCFYSKSYYEVLNHIPGLKRIFLTISLIVLFLSCSDNEEPFEFKPNPIIDKWEGVIVQAKYGTLFISLDITALTHSKEAGRLSYESLDLSQCDETISDCSPITCSGRLIFDNKAGIIYRFSEVIEGRSGCNIGRFEVSLTADDKLNFAWIEEFSVPLSASGILERK